MSRDILVEELRRDRDAAIEEADYERQRAEIAAQRAETLRAEVQRLRTRLEAELAEVKTAMATEHETNERLRRRVRALEVQVRLAQDGTAPDPELL